MKDFEEETVPTADSGNATNSKGSCRNETKDNIERF